MARFVSIDTADVRFPTSRELDGSDVMNPEPDYSAAYLVITTDAGDGIEGHGFTFTTGRGNEVQTAAASSLAPWLVGRDVDHVLANLGPFGRELTTDPQLRWLGPEKGVIHMACGALINALWDLRAKREGLPLWDLLSRLTSDEIADLVDFTYLSDALTRDDALTILRAAEPGRDDRRAALLEQGYPAYTTTPGWLGYDDAKLARLAGDAVADGFELIKLKVGASLDEDIRRMGIARATVGPDVGIAIDANQRWEIDEAVAWVTQLARFDPTWIEEPTNPDDILGHAAIRAKVAPVKVATGEHAHNRVMFRQLLQADAIDVVQIDASRVGGVNENIAIILLAAKFGVPVCPHAGGVGLCELVRHLSMFDFVAVSGTTEGRYIEYVDHLHEHFIDPAIVRGGRYLAPTMPGFSAQMRAESLAAHRFPDGPVWLEA
ncbi:enolase C-terminal domain-like protein [Aeromicrobium sp. 9AM]|uniref:enolase C-terminal domain-like protein n=1 Tax=Aeromicrobium sp. 9AM TaxID=2653126 RepID=UPI0012F37C20|nr:enolase C-terminal domain-like protein [Aeromicrobium sp. 9AM]VXB12825.1 L-fuconate dehydratase [Aeromicrobium sp. 9AM]